MVMTDPIADFLISLKNGYLAGKKQVTVSHSKVKEELGKILVKEGFLKSLKSGQSLKFKTLELELKYDGKLPVMSEITRISKPGLRIYRQSTMIPKVRTGFGITIVSTSSGLMTDNEARKKNLGGEVICQIW